MPTYRERAGIRVVPRTDNVPDAETPSAETLIVVNPARSGFTTPPSSTVAKVGSALSQASAVAGTAAPEASVTCTTIGVRAPIAVGVTAGNESAVTLIAGPGGAAGGTGAGRDPGRRPKRERKPRSALPRRHRPCRPRSRRPTRSQQGRH